MADDAVVLFRGKTDAALELIMSKMRDYVRQYPEARVEVYRSDAVSIRIRVIDPSFAATARQDRVWTYLSTLPEDVQSEISSLTTVTPAEKNSSPSSFKFENSFFPNV